MLGCLVSDGFGLIPFIVLRCRWVREPPFPGGCPGLPPARDPLVRGERGSRRRREEGQALSRGDGQGGELRPLLRRRTPPHPLQVAFRPPPPRWPPHTIQVSCRSSLLPCFLLWIGTWNARVTVHFVGIFSVILMDLICDAFDVRVQEERGEAHPPPRRQQHRGLHAAMVRVRHLILIYFGLCRRSSGSSVVDCC